MSEQQNECLPIREGSLQAAHLPGTSYKCQGREKSFQRKKYSPVVAGSKLQPSCSSKFLLALGQSSLGQKPLLISKSFTSIKRRDFHTKEALMVGEAAIHGSSVCKLGPVGTQFFQGTPVHGGKATLDPTSDTRNVNLRIKGQSEKQQAFI